MTTGDVVNARDRFLGPDVPVTVPMDPADVDELGRLRILEQAVLTPIPVVHLLHLAAAVEQDMAKVAEHERCRYEHIKVGAFDATRRALARLREAQGHITDTHKENHR